MGGSGHEEEQDNNAAAAAGGRNFQILVRHPSYRRSWNGRQGTDHLDMVVPGRSSWHASMDSALSFRLLIGGGRDEEVIKESAAEAKGREPQHGIPEEEIETEHKNSEIRISYGGENESLTAPLLQRPHQVGRGNNTMTADEAEAVKLIKHALNVSYVSGSLSGAGIVGIISGYFENQIGHDHGLHVKICILLMLIAFVSAACIMLLTIPCSSIRVPIRSVRILVFTTLVTITMAMIGACVLLLKLFILLALVPIMLALMISFVEVSCQRQNELLCGGRQVGSSIQGESSYEMQLIV